jgi:hypothetical protein
MNNFSGFDHLAPSRDDQYLSMGMVCQVLQCVPGQLRVLMEDCDIKFAEVRDGIGWLLVEDAERIAEKCRDVRKEIHDAAESYKTN